MVSGERNLHKPSRHYDFVCQEASPYLDGTSITMCFENPRDNELI